MPNEKRSESDKAQASAGVNARAKASISAEASASSNTEAKDFGSWADDLACPACQQALRSDATQVLCTGCGRVYPIINGIPVLIADRAVRTEQPE